MRTVMMALALLVIAGCDSSSRARQSYNAASRWCDDDSFVFDQKRQGTTITMTITCEEEK